MAQHIFSQKSRLLTGLIGKLHVNPEEHFTKHLDFRAISSANFDRKSKCIRRKSENVFQKIKNHSFYQSIIPMPIFPLLPKLEYPVKTDILTELCKAFAMDC